jgi:hypothetical protein
VEIGNVKSRKSKLTVKLYMGIDAKSRRSKLTAKLHMGIDVKSRKSKLTAKLYTFWSFGVNSATKKRGLSHHCS